MEEFTRNQRAEAFHKLPQELKSFIMSDESIILFQDIGKLHVLNIEKIGILADVITLTLVGLASPSQFTSTIQEKLGVDIQKAIAISETVEKEVFLKVRQLLQREPAVERQATISSEEPTRENIIAEIENPTPFKHPISVDQQNTPIPVNLPVITNTPMATPVTHTTIAHDFIAGKMNAPVSMPPQKYSADPYREPLV